MISRIRAYIREHQMITAKDKVLVGISGGADSICLFFVLLELRKELDFEMLCVHVNHGLRGEEADRDEAFVKNLCVEQGIPLVCRACNVKQKATQERLSLEEAGRICRYQVFREEAEANGCTRIAVAHHANDQAETMLFHLFRGTGIRGLSGMEPVRDNIIRPLLCVERKEIVCWLEEHGISWCTDSTNMEEEYTRNLIRHTIVANVQEQINAQAVRHMAETAAELRQIEGYLAEETGKAFSFCVHKEDEACFLYEKAFRQLNAVIAGYVLRKCLEGQGGLRNIERKHIQLLLELWEKQTGSQIDLPGGRRAYREYNGIRICKASFFSEKSEEEQHFYPPIPGSCQAGGEKWVFSIENILENTEKYKLIPEKTYTKWFDYDRIKRCLEIRRRMPGDYLEINKEHSRKKLKDYLIDQKIPREQRNRILMLADGNHIIWIPGGRISEGYKVTEKTKRILKVQIYGGRANG